MLRWLFAACSLCVIAMACWRIQGRTTDHATALPQSGEYWCLKVLWGADDPFTPAHLYSPVRIVEVKEGWVRSRDVLGMEDRMPITDLTDVRARCLVQNAVRQPRVR